MQWCTGAQFTKSITTGASNDGDDSYNSDVIIKRQDQLSYPAIIWCREKDFDWYLPSQKELVSIYKLIDLLNKRGINLHNKWYWTSQEDGGNKAYSINLDQDKPSSLHKFYHNYVRAIARF